MKVCILGVGRSGTTSLYSLFQKILTDQLGEDIDFVYEPFLWEPEAFNDQYQNVAGNFKDMNSISIEGIFNHLQLPLFIKFPGKYKKNNYLKNIFFKDKSKKHLLVKFIRATGRFLLLNQICPEAKFIFIIRNPIDVINSAIRRFSFFGSEFHRNDWFRFIYEVEKFGVESIHAEEKKSQVNKEALYWYHMNKFALESFRRTKNKPLIINYENYAQDRRLWVDKICDFLNVQVKKSYYSLAVKPGGSYTKNININKSDFKLLKTFLDKYSEMLKTQGITNNICYNKIVDRYKNIPAKKIHQQLLLGKTPNHMNDLIQKMALTIQDKDKQISILKQQVQRLAEKIKKQGKT